MKPAKAIAVVVLAACTSGRPPEGAPPVVAVEPAGSNARIETTQAPDASSAPDESIAGGCENGFVEIVDGSKKVRYVLGRGLGHSGTDRGSKNAYVEEVIHQDGQIVLYLEALANADMRGGHLTLTLLQFSEPTSLPATFESGHAEYVAPSQPGQRDEWRRLDAPHVVLTRWGPEGAWVEGTFGPGSAPPVMSAVPVPASSSPPPRPSGSAAPRPPPIMRATVPYQGRFRVCRSKDWRVRH